MRGTSLHGITQRTTRGTDLSAAQRESLLRRSWMANDGLWFHQVFTHYGADVANRLNAAVVRSFGCQEMRRFLRALGVARVTSLEQYHEIFKLAADLYVGDLVSYEEQFERTTHHLSVKRCFAYEGVARAGLDKVYSCGPMQRVAGWFDALKLTVRINPEVGLCQMAHYGRCAYSFHVEIP